MDQVRDGCSPSEMVTVLTRTLSAGKRCLPGNVVCRETSSVRSIRPGGGSTAREGSSRPDLLLTQGSCSAGASQVSSSKFQYASLTNFDQLSMRIPCVV